MNTFALILLAWPLYLAVNGKLVTFADLATKRDASATKATKPAASATKPAS